MCVCVCVCVCVCECVSNCVQSRNLKRTRPRPGLNRWATEKKWTDTGVIIRKSVVVNMSRFRAFFACNINTYPAHVENMVSS